MKISYNWLKQYSGFKTSPAETADILTGCGLEVEGIEVHQSIRGGLAGMMVGEVLQKSRHPNADKLSLTTVSTGDGATYQIVCGAPNVEAGQKVIVATIGTIMYPPDAESFEIKKSKIRGEVSEGMICSGAEIGINDSADGILVLPASAIPGTTAADFFEIKTDHVFEIGLTPNRADATSHMGVARDINAVINAEGMDDGKKLVLVTPDIASFRPELTSPISVKVDDASGCPRYSGLWLTGLTVDESPGWLKEKLTAVGLKPVNNIVDVTNYVMMETGQPLHAFDGDKIQGNEIIVRKLPPQTAFVTLDGTERKLNGEEVMICDSREGLCIGGIYGGAGSGVSGSTTSVFLEAAYFNPIRIRKSARFHGLKTDASFRFERGADPSNTVYALKRAALIMMDLCKGSSCSAVTDVYPAPFEPAEVTLDLESLATLAGVRIPPSVIKIILESVGITIQDENEKEMVVRVPLAKPDVKRPVDVIEEILRIYGYNNIPLPSKMKSSMPVFRLPDRMDIQFRISGFLASQGFNEIMGNSLTKAGISSGHADGREDVKILNPLSHDLGILRQDLLNSGLEALQYNRNRKVMDARIFEFGKIYYGSDNSCHEEHHVCLLVAGKRVQPNWIRQEEVYSVYYLKSLLINILLAVRSGTEKAISFVEVKHHSFSGAMSCVYKNRTIANFGIVKKEITKKSDLEGNVFAIDINMDEMMRCIALTETRITDVPRYPEVKRDLSLLLDKKVSYESVEKTAWETEGRLIKSIQLFDVYQGEKLDADKKSYAVSFILGDEQKTLEEKQIENIMNRLMKNFEQKLGAVIRKS